jgi:hypothetical protein
MTARGTLSRVDYSCAQVALRRYASRPDNKREE